VENARHQWKFVWDFAQVGFSIYRGFLAAVKFVKNNRLFAAGAVIGLVAAMGEC